MAPGAKLQFAKSDVNMQDISQSARLKRYINFHISSLRGPGPQVHKCKVQNLAYLNMQHIYQITEMFALKKANVKIYINSYDSSTIGPGPHVQKCKVHNLAYMNMQHIT